MKKFIIIVVVLIGLIAAWQYFKKPIEQSAPAQAVKENVDPVVNYVPNMIDTKNQAEQNIKDATNKENQYRTDSLNNIQK